MRGANRHDGEPHARRIRGRRHRLLLLAGACCALAAVAIAVVALTGREPAPGPATTQRLLAERLDGKHLTYRYVRCVGNGREYRGRPVERCNVNFNAPHIEVYCSVVLDGRLLTNHEQAAIPCPRDDAGADPPVQVSR